MNEKKETGIKAAQDFVGTHDFKAMCSTDCTKENTVRTIFSFHVRREGELVIFTVSGDGFLYNMVRIMVGTLIFINEGKIGETQIPDILASKDRTRGGKTVPPQGLYLNEVYYDKDKGSEQGEMIKDQRAGGERKSAYQRRKNNKNNQADGFCSA